MVRLFTNSNIYGMSEDVQYPCKGVTTYFDLRTYLSYILNTPTYGSKVETLMRTLEGWGYLTPEDTGLDSYWIVEKAVPKEHREAVVNQEMQPHEVIKILKV